MRIGIGYSNISNSFESGKFVAQTAKENIDSPDFFIAFCNSALNAEKFFKGIKEIAGAVPVIGGSAVGIITRDNLSYEGHSAGALALQGKNISIQIHSTGEIDKDLYDAGKKLAERFSHSDDSQLFFLLYDSICQAATPSSPPIMNASPQLLAGIEDHLKHAVPVLGAGTLGGFDFKPTMQFCGDYAANRQALGLLMSGGFDVYHAIMHGCTPLDGQYLTITKKEGPFIYEINGMPACELIDEVYGSTEWRKQTPVHFLTIGLNKGEKFADFSEDNYINRLIAGALPDGKGICMFEADLDEGTQIQFMLRDAMQMIESVKLNSKKIFNRIEADHRKPCLGIYIDCAGRASIQSHTATEEAACVQQIFNEKNIPLFGFYSGVEIGPFQGSSRGLDWTGVLIILAEK